MSERRTLFDGFRLLVLQFPFGAHAFHAALQHMEKDDIEAAKQLRALNDFLNQKANEAEIARNTVYEEVMKQIRAEGFAFDEQLTLQGTCNIELILQRVLNDCWKLHIDSPALPELTRYIGTHCRIETGNQATWLFFDSIQIARGTNHQLEALRDKLEICATDSKILEIIASLFDFNHHDKLFVPIVKVRAAAREISANIDEEIYTTTAKCCPTFWRLFWDYLF